jgi:hypothetical protein
MGTKRTSRHVRFSAASGVKRTWSIYEYTA